MLTAGFGQNAAWQFVDDAYAKITMAMSVAASGESVFGRYDTNQLWYASGLPSFAIPNSAVPVFPAIGSFAFGMYACPLVTTIRRPSRRRRRFSGFTSSLRTTSGANDEVIPPPAAWTSFRRCGR